MSLEVLSWLVIGLIALSTFASIICAALAKLFEKKHKYFEPQIYNEFY